MEGRREKIGLFQKWVLMGGGMDTRKGEMKVNMVDIFCIHI
jgi:hypothetical protein